MTTPDNTLDPSTVAALPADATYVADEAAEAAIGEASVSAAEAASQQDRDLAVQYVADGGE